MANMSKWLRVLGWIFRNKLKTFIGAVPIALFVTLVTVWKVRGPKRARRIGWSTDGLTRPLSYLERWFSSWELTGTSPGFYICAQLKGKPWDKQTATILLSRVMARHPPSACTIIDTDGVHGPPHWRRLWHPSYRSQDQGEIDVVLIERDSAEPNDSQSWRDAASVHSQISFAAFQASHPNFTMFRLLIIHHPKSSYWEMVLMVHHSMFDGKSACFFMQQIFEEYEVMRAEDNENPTPIDLTKVSFDSIPLFKYTEESKSGNASKQIVPANSNANWPLPMENRTDIIPSLWFSLKELFFDTFPEADLDGEKEWLGPAKFVGGPLDVQTTSLLFTINGKTINTLRAIAKSKATTVTAAIWSAMDVALYWMHFHLTTLLPDEKQTGQAVDYNSDTSELHFGKDTPIDHRPYLGITTEHDFATNLTPLVGAIRFHWHTSKQTKFWENAILTKIQLNDRVTESMMDDMLMHWMPYEMGPWIRNRLASGPNGRKFTIRLSNLGVLNFKPTYADFSNSPLQVRNMWFARETMEDGHLIILQAITPFAAAHDLPSSFSITFPPKLIQPEFIALFKATLTSVLEYTVKRECPSSQGIISSINNISSSQAPTPDFTIGDLQRSGVLKQYSHEELLQLAMREYDY